LNFTTPRGLGRRLYRKCPSANGTKNKEIPHVRGEVGPSVHGKPQGHVDKKTANPRGKRPKDLGGKGDKIVRCNRYENEGSEEE